MLPPEPQAPSGANWIHEIKHDGYWLMVRRDPVGIRLITRRGNDWSDRFPLVVALFLARRRRAVRLFSLYFRGNELHLEKWEPVIKAANISLD